MIAALYVLTNGPYFGIDGVDPWDVHRDARKYAGPHPVVAHPPCSRWCQLAHINQKRYGHRVGDDDGCFESALRNTRKWGACWSIPRGRSRGSISRCRVRTGDGGRPGLVAG